MSPIGQIIDAMLATRQMLNHPFYQAWNEGKLTREALGHYACQYYQFVREFPRMLSNVHANTPDLAIRQEILQNLNDEELDSETNRNHPGLWIQFAESLGIPRSDLLGTTPLPTTQALVDTMMGHCRNGSFQAGLSALYAYESQVPQVSRAKIDGLKTFYGISAPEAVKFFTVHEEADIFHSQSERQLIGRNTPEKLRPEVETAARETADALWNFLTGIQEAYC